jgi:6-phosphogluconolactonase
MITGGDTVGSVYSSVARIAPGWDAIDIVFYDERCVPPDDDRSNFNLAQRTLFDAISGAEVHRIRGEDEPHAAAQSYDSTMRSILERGIQLAVLGLGDNAHIAGLFPHDPAVQEKDALCVDVQRPDGMAGITLTAPALEAPDQVLFVVAGKDKAEAVARAVKATESPDAAPVLLLADHPNCTLLLDEPAASELES